jgi:hypothetical protein
VTAQAGERASMRCRRGQGPMPGVSEEERRRMGEHLNALPARPSPTQPSADGGIVAVIDREPTSVK